MEAHNDESSMRLTPTIWRPNPAIRILSIFEVAKWRIQDAEHKAI